MHPAVLLGLLGAAAVVGSMPVDNGNHNEEMVTRCIIEVLSNALSKSNAPPITPECRQILKKSGKEVKDEEKIGNENTRFEVRLLRDHVDATEAQGPPGREEAEPSQKEDPQDPAMVTEREEGGHSHEGAGTPHESLHPDVNSPVSKEAVAHHSEPSSGEDRAKEPEQHPKGELAEDASQEAPGETQDIFLHPRNQASSKGKEDAASPYGGTHSSERSEEKTHSRERSSQESREDAGSFEKYPHAPKSQAGRQQESEESEEEASPDVDKRRLRHHHGRTRPDRPSQEGSPAVKERDRPREALEESNGGWADVGDRQDRRPSHYRDFQEEPEYRGRAGSSPAVWAPEDVEVAHHRGRGSEEYRAVDPSSQEEEEEEEEEEEQRNRPGLELDNMARGYGEESKEERGWEWGTHPRAKGGLSGASNKEDKRFLSGGYRQLGETQLDKARRYPQGEWDEQDRNDLRDGEGRGEEGGWGRWQQPEYPQESEKREEARLSGQRSTPRYTSEDRKRLGELLSSYFGPSQWKNSHFERKDDVDAGFPEGEEEDRLAVSEKSFFPEYNYDWWEKKPFEDDVNWGYEKRNFAPRLDLKRQYDRVAELDQLLHYRKKAAEFPDFYDSEEPMSLHPAAESEGDRAGPGVLTEEEEKELENLAAMDLELQKIARKFSANRGG